MSTEKIRVIVQSTPDGVDEQVIFTDDLDASNLDFILDGYSIDTDTIIVVEKWPSGFPMNYGLKRV